MSRWPTIAAVASRERTSYCLPCDRVVVWRDWRVWQKHLRSVDHRECVLLRRPLPPERLRPADIDDRLFGLHEGESAVFKRPDGRWIGLANLGAGTSLRIEDSQLAIVIGAARAATGP